MVHDVRVFQKRYPQRGSKGHTGTEKFPYTLPELTLRVPKWRAYVCFNGFAGGGPAKVVTSQAGCVFTNMVFGLQWEVPQIDGTKSLSQTLTTNLLICENPIFVLPIVNTIVSSVVLPECSCDRCRSSDSGVQHL